MGQQKEYFGIKILRGVDHLYIKGKDEDVLTKRAESMDQIDGQGRLDEPSIEVFVTHRSNPRRSPPFSIDLYGGGMLVHDDLFQVLEASGCDNFKALPVQMTHKATKRTWSFWLFKAITPLPLPLTEEPAFFREHRSTFYYFSRPIKEQLESLELNAIRFNVPWHIDTF